MAKGFMKEKKASDTAGYTSAMRAIANLAPSDEKYLSDPFSIEFLPFPWSLTKPLFMAKLFSSLIYRVGMKTPDKMVGFPGMTALACLRHRYIDDEILLAYKEGVRRFIILGAGYDTRSLRLNLPGASMLEVDHPDTQVRKRKILQDKHLQPNCQLEFAAIDFSQPWSEALFSHPYITENTGQSAMVVWEGVSCYLHESDVIQTFEAVSHLLQNGGIFVFDAFSAELMKPDTTIEILRKMRDFVAKKGEPFYWAEDEAPLKKTLSQYGFNQVEAITTYNIAEELSEKENLSISRDEILKYLVMFRCQL